MRVTRGMRFALVSAGLVAALAACGPDRAGSAVVLGSERITDETVAQQAGELATALKLPINAQITAVTVQRLTTNAIVEEAAQQAGVDVDKGEVDQLINEAAKANGGKEQFEQAALQQGLLASQLPIQARVTLLARKLGEKLSPGADTQQANSVIGQDLVRVSKELDVMVSPRFGTWNIDQLTLNPPPNDLSKPLPSTNPSQLLPGEAPEGSGSGGSAPTP